MTRSSESSSRRQRQVFEDWQATVARNGAAAAAEVLIVAIGEIIKVGSQVPGYEMLPNNFTPDERRVYELALRDFGNRENDVDRVSVFWFTNPEGERELAWLHAAGSGRGHSFKLLEIHEDGPDILGGRDANIGAFSLTASSCFSPNGATHSLLARDAGLTGVDRD